MAGPTPRFFVELTSTQAFCLASLLTRATNTPGSQQTHRSRVLNKLHTQLKEFNDARLGLVKAYAVIDKDGEPVVNGDTYALKDPKAFDTAFDTLQTELKIILDGRTDEIMNRALGAVYEILTTDQCPALLPPQPGQAFEQSEAFVFMQLVDSFIKTS